MSTSNAVGQRDFAVFTCPPLDGGENAFGVETSRAKRLGVSLCEGLCPDDRGEKAAEAYAEALSENGLSMLALHAEFPGMRYDTLANARSLMGFTHQPSLSERRGIFYDTGRFAKEIGTRRVYLHPGYVTWDNFSTVLAQLDEAFQAVYDNFGLRCGIESGPIAPDVNAALLTQLQDRGRDPFFSVDPSNLLRYQVAANGEAVVQYAEGVFGAIPPEQVTMHAKDGLHGTYDRNQAWLGGAETPMGEGDADFWRLLTAFDRFNCPSPITMEVELGTQDEKEAAMKAGMQYLEAMMG